MHPATRRARRAGGLLLPAVVHPRVRRPFNALLAALALLALAVLGSGCGVSLKGADSTTGPAARGATLASFNRLPPRPVGTVQVDGRTKGSLTAGVVAADSGSGAHVAVADNGEAKAFSELCHGQLDVVDSAAPISAAQLSACQGNGVQPVQFAVAADAVVLATRSETDVGADCLTLAQIKQIFQAGSQVTNWSQLGYYNVPLQVLGPAESQDTFGFFDSYVLGSSSPSLADLRGDYAPGADDDAVRRALLGGRLGTLGYVRFSSYQQNQGELRPLEIDSGLQRPLLNCVFPSAQTVADGSFPLARQLLLTVGLSDLRRPEVASFMKLYLTSAGRLASAAALVPLPSATLDTELGWLSGVQQPPVIGYSAAGPTRAGTTAGTTVGAAASGGHSQGLLVPAGGVGDPVSAADVPMSAGNTASADQGAAQASSQPLTGGQ
jgi:ABC-type phosphate transport system substrate-binding protein